MLRALEDTPLGLPLRELAAAVELPKSTVHRLARALAEEDLVAISDKGLIQLGGGLARLAAATRGELADDLRPILLALRDELDETTDLAVLAGTSVRFVDQIPATHRLGAVSSVGATFPLHCTANGKALLAAMPDHVVARLLPARLERLTTSTITSRSALVKQLDEIRAAGIAIDRGEHTDGIWAVGAAVRDASGPVAAISVPVPSQRFAGNERRYARAVSAAASSASALLGADFA